MPLGSGSIFRTPPNFFIVHNMNDSGIQRDLEAIIGAANRVILGKEHVIRLALACLFARGHLLIEDLPGVGPATAEKLREGGYNDLMALARRR